MSHSSCRHLFVYGTLMTSAGDAGIGVHERRALHSAARSLGPATLPGRLYDLGRYPVLVDAAADGDLVHGEVLELANPDAIFPIVDPYEGIDPQRPDDGMYRRCVRRARLADGSPLEAWVYLYQRGVLRRRRILDGRWQP